MTLNRMIQSLLMAALFLSLLQRRYAQPDGQHDHDTPTPVRPHDMLRLTNL